MREEEFLERILKCQEGRNGERPTATFAEALREIQRGRKRSHWIWYVWPSLRGVRQTRWADLELPTFAAARALLRHPTLRARLTEITAEAATQLDRGAEKETLFGEQWRYDAPKFHEVTIITR